jgi:hypothetical protein
METTMAETVENNIIQEPEAEAQLGTTQPDDDAVETQLEKEISNLWSNHARLSADRKTTAVELRKIRATLAERLYSMKSLLSRPGRSGQWRSWLKERHIPRSTADRLVTRHAETLDADSENVLSEATISEPTTAEVMKFVNVMWPRICKVLTTRDAVLTFLWAIASEACMNYEWQGKALVVSNPDAEEEDTTEGVDDDDDENIGEAN